MCGDYNAAIKSLACDRSHEVICQKTVPSLWGYGQHRATAKLSNAPKGPQNAGRKIRLATKLSFCRLIAPDLPEFFPSPVTETLGVLVTFDTSPGDQITLTETSRALFMQPSDPEKLGKNVDLQQSYQPVL